MRSNVGQRTAAAKGAAANVESPWEAENESRVSTSGKRRVGAYEIVDELGRGGMASVYLARRRGESGIVRTVALKQIHEHFAKEPDFRAMFLDEARVCCRLEHPYVCKVVDFGKVDGFYFIAMEHLVGETLSKVFRRIARHGEPGGKHQWVVARLIANLCEGLHAAHELRDPHGHPLELVHRDINPQNLFVLYDGTVRVMDFGIARSQGRMYETQTMQLKGKLPYMAPEQILGQESDRRADIWAMGTAAWELLTGERLFKRRNELETMSAIVNQPIPSLTSVAPHVSADLAEVVERALKRNPSERYATAREFAGALERCLTRAGWTVTAGDVVDWLDAVFPSQREVSRARADSAAAVSSPPNQIPASLPPTRRPPHQPRSEKDEVATRLDVTPQAWAQAEPRSEGAEDTETSTLQVYTRSVKRSRGGWLAGTLTVAAALGLALFVRYWPGPTSGADETARGDAPQSNQGAPTPQASAPVAAAPTGDAVSAEPVREMASLPAQDAPLVAAPEPAPTTVTDAPREEPPSVTPKPQPRTHPKPKAAAARKPAPEPAYEPPSAPAALDQGDLLVTTVGGTADVSVDGNPRGTTPLRARLPIGRHSVTLRPHGGQESTTLTAEVARGRVALLRVHLQTAQDAPTRTDEGTP